MKQKSFLFVALTVAVCFCTVSNAVAQNPFIKHSPVSQQHPAKVINPKAVNRLGDVVVDPPPSPGIPYEMEDLTIIDILNAGDSFSATLNFANGQARNDYSDRVFAYKFVLDEVSKIALSGSDYSVPNVSVYCSLFKDTESIYGYSPSITGIFEPGTYYLLVSDGGYNEDDNFLWCNFTVTKATKTITAITIPGNTPLTFAGEEDVQILEFTTTGNNTILDIYSPLATEEYLIFSSSQSLHGNSTDIGIIYPGATNDTARLFLPQSGHYYLGVSSNTTNATVDFSIGTPTAVSQSDGTINGTLSPFFKSVFTFNLTATGIVNISTTSTATAKDKMPVILYDEYGDIVANFFGSTSVVCERGTYYLVVYNEDETDINYSLSFLPPQTITLPFSAPALTAYGNKMLQFTVNDIGTLKIKTGVPAVEGDNIWPNPSVRFTVYNETNEYIGGSSIENYLTSGVMYDSMEIHIEQAGTYYILINQEEVFSDSWDSETETYIITPVPYTFEFGVSFSPWETITLDYEATLEIPANSSVYKKIVLTSEKLVSVTCNGDFWIGQMTEKGFTNYLSNGSGVLEAGTYILQMNNYRWETVSRHIKIEAFSLANITDYTKIPYLALSAGAVTGTATIADNLTYFEIAIEEVEEREYLLGVGYTLQVEQGKQYNFTNISTYSEGNEYTSGSFIILKGGVLSGNIYDDMLQAQSMEGQFTYIPLDSGTVRVLLGIFGHLSPAAYSFNLEVKTATQTVITLPQLCAQATNISYTTDLPYNRVDTITPGKTQLVQLQIPLDFGGDDTPVTPDPPSGSSPTAGDNVSGKSAAEADIFITLTQPGEAYKITIPAINSGINVRVRSNSNCLGLLYKKTDNNYELLALLDGEDDNISQENVEAGEYYIVIISDYADVTPGAYYLYNLKLWNTSDEPEDLDIDVVPDGALSINELLSNASLVTTITNLPYISVGTITDNDPLVGFYDSYYGETDYRNVKAWKYHGDRDDIQIELTPYAYGYAYRYTVYVPDGDGGFAQSPDCPIEEGTEVEIDCWEVDDYYIVIYPYSYTSATYTLKVYSTDTSEPEVTLTNITASSARIDVLATASDTEIRMRLGQLTLTGTLSAGGTATLQNSPSLWTVSDNVATLDLVQCLLNNFTSLSHTDAETLAATLSAVTVTISRSSGIDGELYNAMQVYAFDREITICHAPVGARFAVINLIGKTLQSGIITSDWQAIPVLQSGIYIVRVDGKAIKVAVR
ncbi:MAG: DUF6383 domain-containing protein [Prevotellaceae bacterium]|jgi:hypothetical protein|nr:DUF6383 domain-containing protein [Prevotellaceae bacterium]